MIWQKILFYLHENIDLCWCFLIGFATGAFFVLLINLMISYHGGI
ncbi:hypothetical protein AAEX28_04010 [Lentisphaerota bacterium WC36G]